MSFSNFEYSEETSSINNDWWIYFEGWDYQVTEYIGTPAITVTKDRKPHNSHKRRKTSTKETYENLAGSSIEAARKKKETKMKPNKIKIVSWLKKKRIVR